MPALQLVAYWTPEREEDLSNPDAETRRHGDAVKDQNQIILDYSLPLMTGEERAVWSVLSMCRGRELAILGPEIEELTGIRYKRVQKVINDLRCHHAKMIGSGTCGYYLPQTPEEMEAVIHYIRDRAIAALYTLSKIKNTSMEEIFQQLRVEFRKAG